jgi:tetratricopeptide (TPR) repeat protein
VAARRADRLAAAALPILTLATLALLLLAAVPRTVGGVPRLWLLGAAIGLATGLPFALERRTLRRRAAAIPPLVDPPALGTHTTGPEAAVAGAVDRGDLGTAQAMLVPLLEDGSNPEALRLGALIAARRGEVRAARLQALRAAQLDPSRWDALLDTGAALCRRGRFAEGVRLLNRGAELAGRSRPALLVLAAGHATAGQLREAVSAFDEARGLSAPRGR